MTSASATDRPAARSGPARLAALLAGASIAAAAATALAPAALAQEGLTITTPYPAVSVAPGANVSFELNVKVTETRRVDLKVGAAPEGWTATLRGGGYVVNGLEVTPDESPAVRLDVKVPGDAGARMYRLSVSATSGTLTDTLSLDVTVNEAAAGQIALTTDFPEQQGASDATYRFNLTLRNDTAQDLTFGLNAVGPDGWIVSARPSGQSQATSVQVDAGGSTTVSVEADPPDETPAGTYPISVTATETTTSTPVSRDLSVKIIGQFEMRLTTQDGRLNANGQAGSTIERTLIIQNTGTSDLTGVELTNTAPSGWKVEFDPAEVPPIPATTDGAVTAKITPASSAVAGDYVVTFRATAKEQSTTLATASADIRVTVETSQLLFVLGLGVVLAVLAGLWYVFGRYGRR